MMKRLMGCFVGMVGLALAVFSNVALAAPTECDGLLSGHVAGGVVVNDGDTCFLGGATVSGGVQVNGGGQLVACASTINGGLVANDAVAVIVGAEEVLGCSGNLINGGVHVSNARLGALPEQGPPAVAVENSVIKGGVFLTDNLGWIAVVGNTIAGGLFCSNNAFDLVDENSPSKVTGKTTCKFE